MNDANQRYPNFLSYWLLPLGSVAFMIVIFLLAMFLAIDSLDMCGNEITRETISPDRRLKAVIFSRSCGATTGFSTQVSLIPNGDELPNESGNAIVVTNDSERFPQGILGVLEVEAVWEDKTEITILHHPQAAVAQDAPIVEGVKIKTQPYAR